MRAVFIAKAALVLAACVADGSQSTPTTSGQTVSAPQPQYCGHIAPRPLPNGVQRIMSESTTSDPKFTKFLGYRDGRWTDGMRLNLCTILNVVAVDDAGNANTEYCNGAAGDMGYSLFCARVPGKIVGDKLTIYPYDTRPFTYEYRPDGSLQGTFPSQSGNRRNATLTPR